jgi:hypothetical protein
MDGRPFLLTLANYGGAADHSGARAPRCNTARHTSRLITDHKKRPLRFPLNRTCLKNCTTGVNNIMSTSGRPCHSQKTKRVQQQSQPPLSMESLSSSHEANSDLRCTTKYPAISFKHEGAAGIKRLCVVSP